MASYIKRGENVFFQFRDGRSVLNSQAKPRMFKTAEKATLGVNYVETDDIVEYAERKHGRWVEKVGRAMCSVCADECWADSVMEYDYCPNCGTKMNKEEK